MAITVALVSRFKSLNQDNFQLKQHANSREREAIVDITWGASDNYATGGNTVDFSTVRGFKKVYAVEFLHISKGLIPTFVPATADAAATGKVKLFGVDPGAAGGAIVDLPELPAASTVTNNLVIRARIRGN